MAININIPTQVTQTITNGITATAPSEDAVFDALALKQSSLGYTAEDIANKSTNVNTDQASNTKYPSVKAVYDWAVALFQTLANKDATGGYAGLTLFKINFKNTANTFTSFFTNSNSAARTYTFQNRDGTIADDTDLALKAPLSSPTFTGNPAAPTQILYDNSTKLATTAYVDSIAIPSILSQRKVGTTTLTMWYSSAICNFTPTTLAEVKDFVDFYPFYVEKTITLDRIQCEITSAGAGGSTVTLAIYNSSNNLPTTVLLNAGTINGNSATVQAITISQQLTPGLYFLALAHGSSSAITFRAIPAIGMSNVLGNVSTMGATATWSSMYVAQAYGSLPASPSPTLNTGAAIWISVRAVSTP